MNTFKIEKNNKTYEIEISNNYATIYECANVIGFNSKKNIFTAWGEEANNFTFKQAVELIEKF